ncbi:ubiquitin carboxyl-terminal hydrolase 37-like isoform X2 [Anoplopoma fimbria]|uniref:ubiquitin carboxyl-terminal hydrolase 37-like isoform X2 n=1 Tax=Anoplopoma fimbria TaxID=229290 RepID=UPI0023EBD685|nr:ubiquitin carboxyl-terminal hydrolase 37-like isoform X2 [Anoplopoma fimbria]
MMFELPCCRRKKKGKTTEASVEKQSRPHSITRVAVSDAPNANTSAENRQERTPWQHRLFGRPVRRQTSPKKPTGDESGQQSDPQQRVSDAPASSAPLSEKHQQTEKKSRWRCRVFDFCRKKSRVAPTPEKEDEQKAKDDEKAANKVPELPVLTSVQAVPQTLARTRRILQINVAPFTSTQSLRVQQHWLGFPNPAQICYVNSSLQSLLTLTDFTRAVNSQEDVWGSIPEAELIRRFLNIARCHKSMDSPLKLKALYSFKRTLSDQAPEFQDHRQKDAHEFLTTILDQIRSLSPLLQEVAACCKKSYRCPVEDHLVFRMQMTRTCRRCGSGSTRQEDFTNLSLNLVPGGSVQQMVQDYLMEAELDFRCDCGGSTSGQQSTFATLPRVLMLHLKRFRFTPSLQLEKLNDPVELFRELLVTSKQAEGWYSLVSVISHLGSRGNSGHYVSDGMHPEAQLDDSADRWLTYNDSEVIETTGASVCQRRQRAAYILLYQRRM